MTFSKEQQETIHKFRPVHSEVLEDGDFIVVIPLLFHMALYVNLTSNGDFEDRYCIEDLKTCRKAIKTFNETGEWKYWQKWWNKNISVKGNYAYRTGELQMPENALYEVDWSIDHL